MQISQAKNLSQKSQICAQQREVKVKEPVVEQKKEAEDQKALSPVDEEIDNLENSVKQNSKLRDSPTDQQQPVSKENVTKPDGSPEQRSSN